MLDISKQLRENSLTGETYITVNTFLFEHLFVLLVSVQPVGQIDPDLNQILIKPFGLEGGGRSEAFPAVFM